MKGRTILRINCTDLLKRVQNLENRRHPLLLHSRNLCIKYSHDSIYKRSVHQHLLLFAFSVDLLKEDRSHVYRTEQRTLMGLPLPRQSRERRMLFFVRCQGPTELCLFFQRDSLDLCTTFTDKNWDRVDNDRSVVVLRSAGLLAHSIMSIIWIVFALAISWTETARVRAMIGGWDKYGTDSGIGKWGLP